MPRQLKILLPFLSVTFINFVSVRATASILPPNQLSVEDAPYKHRKSKLSAKTIQPIIDAIKNLYAPLAEKFNATFDIQLNTESSDVNALASRQDSNWVIFIYGGFIRRPEMTSDALTIAVCHEAGHLFGGYPFTTGKENLSSEGQADYFATQVCARALWANDEVKNASFAKKLMSYEKEKCDQAWSADNIKAQQLCYRIAAAAKPLAVLLGRISNENESEPQYETPDSSVVEHTLFDGYPKTQCRLDTFLAGALCGQIQSADVIPGFGLLGRGPSLNTVEAEQESRANSCYGNEIGSRGKCWFKELDDSGVRFPN